MNGDGSTLLSEIVISIQQWSSTSVSSEPIDRVVIEQVWNVLD